MDNGFLVNACGLSEELKFALSEILAEDGGRFDENGYEITAEKGECLKVEASTERCKITYSKKSEFFRGFAYLCNRVPQKQIVVEERKKFDNLCLMADNSRNAVFNMNTAKALVRTLAKIGFDSFELYTEDTFEVDGEPYFGHLRGRWSKAELKELDAYANAFGIELIPCVQTLAHVNQITRWKVYSENVIDCNDILLAGSDRTYRLLDNIFKTLAECFTSRRVNIGMDEAHMVGLGRYLDEHGYKDRFEIIREHLTKVIEICKKYGFKPAMWSDMFFRLLNNGEYYDGSKLSESEIKSKIPDGVDLIYWDYYHTYDIYRSMLASHKKLTDNVQFAGGAWKWIGFAPDNRFSLWTSEMALDACEEAGVKDVTVTAWGDNGGECSIFAVLPVLVYFGERAYGHKSKNSFAKAFERVADCSLKDYISVDLPNRQRDNDDPLERATCKTFFYNDLFTGSYDTLVDEKSGEIYKKNAAILKRVAKKTVKYSYIFESEAALTKVLSIKYDLGIKTRKAYLSGDKEAVKALLPEYKKLLKAIDEFYKLFKRQWFIENKPHGFDVQDIRIGGLIRRVRSCMERLEAFLNGEIEKIEELDEALLDALCREKIEPCYDYEYQLYSKDVTVNIL